MDREKKILTLLGFANKAGKLALGKQAALHAFKKKKAVLVLLSNDVSPKTIDELQRIKAEWHRLMSVSRSELARITGRRELTVVAVLDYYFAKSIRSLLN